MIRIRDLRGGSATETRYDGQFDPRYLVRSGDLLIGMDGEFACYEWHGEPALLNQRVCRLHGFAPDLVPRYLFYGINRHLKEIEDVTGFATVKHLSSKSVLNIEMAIPSLVHQRRIVAVLDDAFAAIATAQANTLQNLRNARELFESHLNAILTERGEDWADKSLAEICVVDWGNTDLTKSAYVLGGKYLAVSAAGCDGRIDHAEHRRHTPVLSAIGANCGTMFLPEEDFTAIKNTITLTPRDGRCTGEFLYRVLMHVDLPRRGAAQPFIAKGDIQAFRVSVPTSVPLQQRIGEAIDRMEGETQRLEGLYRRKLAELEELKKSFLHHAFMGSL